jgi:hypothetical protein
MKSSRGRPGREIPYSWVTAAMPTCGWRPNGAAFVWWECERGAKVARHLIDTARLTDWGDPSISVVNEPKKAIACSAPTRSGNPFARQVAKLVHSEYSMRGGLGRGRGLELTGWADRSRLGLLKKAFDAGFYRMRAANLRICPNTRRPLPSTRHP